jgi:hypothetical protein
MFEMGKDYAREYIHVVCGGNKQAFLPTKQGRVVAACLRQDLNPQAPEVVLCNSTASARAAGRTLSKQEGKIPVFIEQGAGKLRFVGEYSVAESFTTPLDCAPYAKDSSFRPQQISRVIKLKRS